MCHWRQNGLYLIKDMASAKQLWPLRGELYLVNFDPTIGSEIQKTRPALIIQNDIANRHSPVTIVAALSGQVDEMRYPTEVLLEQGEGGIEKRSVVLLNQVRTIDKRRLIKKLGTLKSETMNEVDRALAMSVGIVKL